jgi:peptide chain release factor 2
MQEAKRRATELSDQVEEAFKKLNLEDKIADIEELRAKLAQPDYWQKTENSLAQEESKKLAELETLVAPWQELSFEVKEITEFLDLGDETMLSDLEARLGTASNNYDELKSELRFSGDHDASNVVLSVQAGAGGNDAQDWAQMLFRMYTRWAEKNDLKISVLSESAGEEAGLKSVSASISGSNAYGKLKGEHGVHRLVRLSPFNSANSRETSFAMVEVVPEIDSPDEIEIDENDLRVDVYRAGGHGGQSVNTTDSAVRITHNPTGIVVSIQNERSQIQNKETALKVLKSRLAQLAEEQHEEEVSKLKGPNQEAAWGNQIRSYVLHPYTMVKDSRSNYSTTDVEAVLGGDITGLIDAYLDATMGDKA